MKRPVSRAPAALKASLQTQGRPSPLLVATGATLLVVLAVAGYVLWPRHDHASGPDSDVYRDGSGGEITSARSRDRKLPLPSLPATVPAGKPVPVVPTATNDASAEGSGCGESSFRFREIVAPCFGSLDLCNVGVSVRFDGEGQPVDVSFISAVPPAIAEQARQARACVERSFTKLSTPCSRSKSVHYTHRCTLH